MNFNRQEIKANAKVALKANYWPMVGITFLMGIIIAAVSMIPFVGWVASIIATPVMAIGLNWFNLSVFRGEQPEIGTNFAGFKDGKFGHVLGGYWFMTLCTFLWTLLFVIPGIIKAYAYCLTPYILMDDPEVSATDALKKSMEMTKGHKLDIFVFQLSYIGWILLSGLTFDILGVFYVFPYYGLGMAGVYESIKKEYEANNGTATTVEM